MNFLLHSLRRLSVKLIAMLCLIGVCLNTIKWIENQQDSVLRKIMHSSVFHSNEGPAKWRTMYNPQNRQKVFLHEAFYDDRIPENTSILLFILSENVMDLATPVQCLAQYSSQNPSVINGSLVKIEISQYKVSGIRYVPVMVICAVDSLLSNYGSPNAVSLHFGHLDNNKSTVLVPVVYKRPNNPHHNLLSDNNRRMIGVCLSAQYGTIDDEETFFFIQWMEALSLFGIQEVVMYNSSLRFEGKLTREVFRYYESRKMLIIHQFQPPMVYDKKDTVHANEIIRMHVANHCLHNNRDQYWYLLHIDRDELPIPLSAATYQGVIELYLSRDRKNVDYDSISMPSALFYRHFPPGNTTAPNTMPLMKFTNRVPTEPKRIGSMKSFINLRMCTSIWSHKCLIRADFKPAAPNVINQTDLMLYHYRKRCRKADHECKAEWDSQFMDTLLLQKYGKLLEYRTLKVLNSVKS